LVLDCNPGVVSFLPARRYATNNLYDAQSKNQCAQDGLAGGGNVRDSLEETVLRCSLNLENIVNQEYHCLWDSSRAVVGVEIPMGIGMGWVWG